MSLNNVIAVLVIIGIIVALIILVPLAGFYIGAFTSDWNPFKYRPYTLGNLDFQGDVLVINTPFDVYVVINGGQRILGPGNKFEIRLNGTALVELWHASGTVYRYLIYWDGSRYRVILHECACSRK